MPISNQLINYFINKIEQLNTYSQDDMSKIKYSLQSIFYEFEKMAIIFCVFFLLDQADYYLITLMVLLSIRINAGGFHNKTNLGCLFFTFSMFFIAINIFPNLQLNTLMKYILAIGAVLTPIFLAPIFSIEKQSIYRGNTLKNKILSSIFTIFWLMIFFYKNNIYAIPVLGIIVLQNLQLLFEFIRRKVTKK